MSHYIGSFSRKVSPGQQFTGKNPPRPAAAWTGRIFTGKLSAGDTFLGGNPIMGRLIYGAGDILIKERQINFVIISVWADF